MRRTQLYLSVEQRLRLDALGRARGRTMADLVREAVDRYLATSDAAGDDGAGLGLIGALGDLERARDVGERHDRYLAKARTGEVPAGPKRAPRAARKQRKS